MADLCFTIPQPATVAPHQHSAAAFRINRSLFLKGHYGNAADELLIIVQWSPVSSVGGVGGVGAFVSVTRPGTLA